MPMIAYEVQIFISSRGPALRVMHASCLERLFCQFECALSGNRPGSTSCGGSPAGVRPAGGRRGAAWVWPKEGWHAQHGARERREVSLVETTTGVHRGAGGRGYGVPGGWGAKKKPPNWPWMQLGRCAPQMPSAWHPQRREARGESERRWLDFESWVLRALPLPPLPAAGPWASGCGLPTGPILHMHHPLRTAAPTTHRTRFVGFGMWHALRVLQSQLAAQIQAVGRAACGQARGNAPAAAAPCSPRDHCPGAPARHTARPSVLPQLAT
jgi:hypothetical protein